MDGEIIRDALRCSARLNALLGRDLRSRDSLPLEARLDDATRHGGQWRTSQPREGIKPAPTLS